VCSSSTSGTKNSRPKNGSWEVGSILSLERELEKSEVEESITSLNLYIGMQEIARQITGINRDLGFLLLKVFKRYFEQNERMWLKLINKWKATIDELKADREMLLTSHVLPCRLEKLLDSSGKMQFKYYRSQQHSVDRRKSWKP
jgi:hypothetical protein